MTESNPSISFLDRTRAFIPLGLLALCLSCAQQPAQEAEVISLPIAHYFDTTPEQLVYQLSPDGSKLASLVQTGGAINIKVIELASGKTFSTTNFSNSAVGAFAWANEERLIFWSGDVRNLLSVRFDGNQRRQLNPRGDLMRTLHRLPHDDDSVLVAIYTPVTEKADLFTLNIINGSTQRILRGPRNAWPDLWLMNAGGDVAAATVRYGDEVALLAIEPETAEWMQVRRDSRWAPKLRVLDAPLEDDAALAWQNITNTDAGNVDQIVRMNIYNGEIRSTAGPAPGPNCCRVITGAKGVAAVVYAGSRDRVSRLYLDPSIATATSTMAESLPGRQLNISQTDDTGMRSILVATSVLQDPDYYLLESGTGTAELLERSPQVINPLSVYRQDRGREVQFSMDRSSGLDMRSGQPATPRVRQVDRTGLGSSTGGN